MGATFSRIKTWSANETLTASDLNAEFNNILNNLTPTGMDDASSNATAMQATTDPYPASSESLATNLLGEIQRLRYVIKQITGEAQWYIDPTYSFTGGTLQADTIVEKTGAAGVTADSVLLKDNTVTATTLTANTSVVTDTISEKTGAAGVTIDSLLIKDGGISDGTNIIKTKIIDIGDWNMDSTQTVSIAHGVTLGKIRGATIMIRDDSDAAYSVGGGSTGTGSPVSGAITNQVGIFRIDSTNINIGRLDSGSYDNGDYDSTSYNRGWITITYVV